jgi:putative flippase GtrA
MFFHRRSLSSMTPPVHSLTADAALDTGALESTALQGGLLDRIGGRRATLLRFIRFAVVGGLASAVYLGLTAVLMAAGLHYMEAATAAFACAIVTNFAVNRSWTFGAGERHVLLQLASFATVQVSMAVVNLTMLYLVVENIGIGPVFMSQLFVAGVLLPINFLASRRWGFR